LDLAGDLQRPGEPSALSWSASYHHDQINDLAARQSPSSLGCAFRSKYTARSVATLIAGGMLATDHLIAGQP
jgi:hypothetical protein